MNPTSRSVLRRRSRRRRSSSFLPRIDTTSAPLIQPSLTDATSARRLAAALWKMQLGSRSDLFQMISEEASTNNDNSNRNRRRFNNNNTSINGPNQYSTMIMNDIFFKLEACAKLPNTDMEKITKWDYYSYSSLIFLNKPSKPYKITDKSVESSPSLKTRKNHNAMSQKIDSIKQNLNLERENRLKMEEINSKLLFELNEAKSSIKKYFKGYEKERKKREQIEEICEDLAKEIEQEKDQFETLKIDSLRIREELEEERRMLQMAEVWREERVQMKLVDAKITLENKYSYLNTLQDKIESFLRAHSHADVATVKKAETLIRATKESINNNNNKVIKEKNWFKGETSNLLLEGSIKGSCESSQGSAKSINGVFKENNCYNNEGENEISEVCSSVTKQSRNNNNNNYKESSFVNKIWGNNGNGKKAGTDLQKKKRRSGLKGKIVGVKKEGFNNGGIIGENINGFVF